MSKASNYVTRLIAAKTSIPPDFDAHDKDGRTFIASVLTDGSMKAMGVMPPDLALKFANWIYATFGDYVPMTHCEKCGFCPRSFYCDCPPKKGEAFPRENCGSMHCSQCDRQRLPRA